MKKGIWLLMWVNLLWIHNCMAQAEYLGNDSLLVIQEGTASFYGKRFHKRKTASGEIFDMHGYTAAHKHLPFGTYLKVINQANGYEVIIKINDRLPKSSKRIIDLSRNAAEQLDMIREGLSPVKLQALSFDEIERLKNHYKVIPEELRLRIYHQPVQWTAPVASFFPLLFQNRLNVLGLPIR